MLMFLIKWLVTVYWSVDLSLTLNLGLPFWIKDVEGFPELLRLFLTSKGGWILKPSIVKNFKVIPLLYYSQILNLSLKSDLEKKNLGHCLFEIIKKRVSMNTLT